MNEIIEPPMVNSMNLHRDGSMIYFIDFGRFLDGKSMEIDQKWSIFGSISSTIER